MTIPSGNIEINGDLAVWHHGDFVFISGGAYPGENFYESTSSDITEAITVSVEIDLGLNPDQYRRETRDLIRKVR